MWTSGTARHSDDLKKTIFTHILRLPATRPVSLALKWTPEDGRKRLGRPKRSWRDPLKDLEEMCVD